MRRALTIAATIYTASRLARLFAMPARPIVTAPKVAPKAALDPNPQGRPPTVDLVKWEQEPEPRDFQVNIGTLSWDPAADLLDEAAAEDALIVHSGWGAEVLAEIDELPEVRHA